MPADRPYDEADHIKDIERILRNEEAEACAEIAEEHSTYVFPAIALSPEEHHVKTCRQIAEAIRARIAARQNTASDHALAQE
jgi:hypothetical protein